MRRTVHKNFVTFLSPGTFLHEESTLEIESLDVGQAVEMSRSIVERYDARPFAFYFTTRARSDEDLDSRETSRSHRYYLGGKIETVDDVRARNDPNEQILLSNMECNRWGRIVTNTNSWKITQPLDPEDVVLDISWTPKLASDILRSEERTP